MKDENTLYVAACYRHAGRTHAHNLDFAFKSVMEALKLGKNKIEVTFLVETVEERKAVQLGIDSIIVDEDMETLKCQKKN